MSPLFISFTREENTDTARMKILSNFPVFIRAGDALLNDNRQQQHSVINHFIYLEH